MKSRFIFLLASVVSALPACALAAEYQYHAWVDANSSEGDNQWDYYDNLNGMTADGLTISTPSYNDPTVIAARGSGSVDLSNLQAHLMADHTHASGYDGLRVRASFLDWYTFTAAQAQNGTSMEGVYLDIAYGGLLSTEAGGQAAAVIIDSGNYSILYRTIGSGVREEVTGTGILPLCISGACPVFGQPYPISLTYIVDVVGGFNGGRSIADFSHSFTPVFRWDDPDLALTITSVGGYTQPVPEPETWSYMLAGLGLLGWAARRRAKAVDACLCTSV